MYIEVEGPLLQCSMAPAETKKKARRPVDAGHRWEHADIQGASLGTRILTTWASMTS